MIWSFHTRPGSGWQRFTRMSDNVSSYGLRVLLILAALLIGIGVLVLLVPIIVAILVAVICFFGAMKCLHLAWLLYKKPKKNINFNSERSERIHVEVYEGSTITNKDTPPAQLP